MNPIEMLRPWILYLQARMGLDERGSSLIEYALLLTLIAMVCLLAVTYLGQSTSGRYSNVASRIAG
jgi:Flp pilus assembly pilin Flp